MPLLRQLQGLLGAGLVAPSLVFVACSADPASTAGNAGSSNTGGNNGNAGTPPAGGYAGVAGTPGGGFPGGGNPYVGGNAGAAVGGMAGTAGGGNVTMLTQPVQRSDKMVLEFGSTFFEVTPAHGARVTSLRYLGQELLSLTGPADNPDMYGSTFWPSPQSLWNWPPPAEIDNGVYTAAVDASHLITAIGGANAALGLSVTKKFSANLAKEAIEVEYVMTNSGATARSAAPWEITRVPATGIAFWPKGGAPFGPNPLLATEEAAGHSWCTPAATAGTGKVFADGVGGWLAYVVGDLLLVKQFQDQPASAAAPNEAEVEIYINAAHSYVEVEQQGAFTSIAPAASVSWKVTWYARKLPAGVTATVGNADLIAFVTQTLQ